MKRLRNDELISLPIFAKMQKQEDGSYILREVRHMSVGVDELARFFLTSFDVPCENELPTGREVA